MANRFSILAIIRLYYASNASHTSGFLIFLNLLSKIDSDINITHTLTYYYKCTYSAISEVKPETLDDDIE